MRFAGLWLFATMAGFVIAISAEFVLIDPAIRAALSWQAQSTGGFAAAADVQIAIRWIGVLIVAALIPVFQAVVLQVRLGLGIGWVVAAVAAAAVGRLLVMAIAHSLQPPPINQVNALLISSLVPGIAAGLAAWLVLRRLPRAPLLVVAIPFAALAASSVQLEIARWLEFAPLAENYGLQALASGLLVGAIQGPALAWIIGDGQIAGKEAEVQLASP